MSGLGIQISRLYQLVGGDPQKLVALAENGMSRAEMLAKHNHILALKDINLDIESGRIQVIMGHSSIQQTMDTYGHLFPAADEHESLAEASRHLLPALRAT